MVCHLSQIAHKKPKKARKEQRDKAAVVHARRSYRIRLLPEHSRAPCCATNLRKIWQKLRRRLSFMVVS